MLMMTSIIKNLPSGVSTTAWRRVLLGGHRVSMTGVCLHLPSVNGRPIQISCCPPLLSLLSTTTGWLLPESWHISKIR